MKLSWRVPMGTAQPIEAGAQLVLEPVPGNWDFIAGSLQDQAGTGAFARFTTITDRYGNVPAGRLTYTLDAEEPRNLNDSGALRLPRRMGCPKREHR